MKKKLLAFVLAVVLTFGGVVGLFGFGARLFAISFFDAGFFTGALTFTVNTAGTATGENNCQQRNETTHHKFFHNITFHIISAV